MDEVIPPDKIKKEPDEENAKEVSSPETPVTSDSLPVGSFSAAALLTSAKEKALASKKSNPPSLLPQLEKALTSQPAPIIIRPQGNGCASSSPILLVPVSSSGVLKSPGQSLLKANPITTRALLPQHLRSASTVKSMSARSDASSAAVTAVSSNSVKGLASSTTMSVKLPLKKVSSVSRDNSSAGLRMLLPGNTVSSLYGLVFNWRTLGPDGNPVTFKDYLCNYCQEKYRDENELKDHIAVHKFVCNHCEFASFSRFTLICHKQCRHPDHIEEILGFEGFENANVSKNTNTDSVASADSTINTPLNEVKVSSEASPGSAGVVKAQAAQSTSVSNTVSTSVPKTVAVSSTASILSKKSTSPATPRSPKGAAANNYFTYKIVHNKAGSAVAYECDVCSFQTFVLKNIYEHASTHTLDDLQKSTGGNTVWECFYCQYKASLQVVVVDHVTTEHPGKPVQLKRYQTSTVTPGKQPSQVSGGNTPPTVKALLAVKRNEKGPQAGSTSESSAVKSLLINKKQGELPSESPNKRYVWGCYYCEYISANKDHVVDHEKGKHSNQKLVITRREVTNLPLAALKLPAPTVAISENPSRRKQSFLQKIPEGDGSGNSTRSLLTGSKKSSAGKQKLEDLKDPNDPSAIDKTVEMLMDNYAEDFAGSEEKDEQIKSEISGPPAIIEYMPVTEKEVDYSQLYVYTPAKGIGKCNLCSKEFTGRHALGHVKEHVTSHTGEKAWGCPYCDFKSNRRVSTHKHVQSRHKESPLKIIRRKPYRSSGKPSDIKSYITMKPNNKLSNDSLDLDQPKKSKLRGPRSVRERKLLAEAKTLWQCPLCMRRSVFKGTIVVHMKLVHPGSQGNLEIQRWARPKEPGRELRAKSIAQVLLQRIEHMEEMEEYKTNLESSLDPLIYDRDLDDDAESGEEFSSTLKYKCRECNFRAYRTQKVKAHILAYHPGAETVIEDLRKTKKDRLYFCPFSDCHYTTSLKEALRTHIQKNPSHCTDDFKLLEPDQPAVDSGQEGNSASRLISLRSAEVKAELDESNKEISSADLSIEQIPEEKDSQNRKRKSKPREGRNKKFCSAERSVLPPPVVAEPDAILPSTQETKKDASKDLMTTEIELMLCKYCSEMVTSDLEIMRHHLANVHPSMVPIAVNPNDRPSVKWFCLQCDFIGMDQIHLQNHKRWVHSDASVLENLKVATDEICSDSSGPVPSKHSDNDDDPDYCPKKSKKRSKRVTNEKQQKKTEQIKTPAGALSKDPSSISENEENDEVQSEVRPKSVEERRSPSPVKEQSKAPEIPFEPANFDETPDGRYSIDGVLLSKPRPLEKSVKFPKRFLCDDCQECFDLLEQIRQHQLAEGHCRLSTGGYCCSDRRARAMRKKKRIYFCEQVQCLYYCKTLLELSNHMSTCLLAEDGWDKASNNDCGADDDDDERNETDAADKIYQCSYCTCIMTRIDHVKQHLLTEHDTKEGGYTEMHSSFTADGNLHINVKDENSTKGSSSPKHDKSDNENEHIVNAKVSSTDNDTEEQQANDLDKESDICSTKGEGSEAGQDVDDVGQNQSSGEEESDLSKREVGGEARCDTPPPVLMPVDSMMDPACNQPMSVADDDQNDAKSASSSSDDDDDDDDSSSSSDDSESDSSSSSSSSSSSDDDDDDSSSDDADSDSAMDNDDDDDDTPPVLTKELP